jgi:hypothetical protein
MDAIALSCSVGGDQLVEIRAQNMTSQPHADVIPLSPLHSSERSGGRTGKLITGCRGNDYSTSTLRTTHRKDLQNTSAKVTPSS